MGTHQGEQRASLDTRAVSSFVLFSFLFFSFSFLVFCVVGTRMMRFSEMSHASVPASMRSAAALFSAFFVLSVLAQTPPNCNRVDRPGICCPDGQWPGYPSYRPQFAGDGVCDLFNQIPGCFDGGDCCLATVIGDPRNNLTVEEIYNAPYNDNTYVTPLADRPTFDYQVLDIPNREPTCRALLFNCPDPIQVRGVHFKFSTLRP